jgi:hypothetical protein
MMHFNPFSDLPHWMQECGGATNVLMAHCVEWLTVRR